MLDVYRKLTFGKRLSIVLPLAGVLALVLVVIGLSIPLRSATLKARVIELLTEELESEVTIDSARRTRVSARVRQRPGRGDTA